jgi:short-subunit dehydrogenase
MVGVLSMRLVDQHVLVTGATGGLGGAIARELSAKGCVLTVTGRDETELARLVTELGPRTQGIRADLSNPVELHHLVNRLDDVDVLVASAGVGPDEDLADISEGALEEAVRVNLTAPALLARALAAGMKRRGAGHIVFICSVAGLVATPANSAMYTTTKWGLRGLGLALRQELADFGIGVSTIFPGPVREAGMSVRPGVVLPRGVGTVSPRDVASAVVRAVEGNRAEVIVATAGLRLGAAAGRVAPVLVGRVGRLVGANRIRQAMLIAQGRTAAAELDG